MADAGIGASRSKPSADAGTHIPRSPPVGATLEGWTYAAWHPFKREVFEQFCWDDGGTGVVAETTWVPGWRYEPSGPEDVEEVWDGEGEQLRTIVSFHRPGLKYPERVFYVRQWRDPDGKVFGRTALRMTTTATFNRWLTGERWPRWSRAFNAHRIWLAARDMGSRVAAQVADDASGRDQ